MELLFNELSIHGQFSDLNTFRAALSRVMVIRTRIRELGFELYCHRNLVNRRVTENSTMPQAVQALDRNSRRALMGWMTRHGPYWEDLQAHSGDDYLECSTYNDGVVTDTAVGEAAYNCLWGGDRRLVSLVPSAWKYSPIPVEWHREDEVESVEIHNYWEADLLEAKLRSHQPPLESWSDLETTARTRCPGLVFAHDSFGPLAGNPFRRAAAYRILSRLNALHVLKNSFDEHGERTAAGHRLYQKHFTGANAWFSDSSASEKHEFRTELTFPNPAQPSRPLFCTWHGKVKTSQLRIHFSWPVRATQPLYVVYIGPKLTKR